MLYLKYCSFGIKQQFIHLLIYSNNIDITLSGVINWVDITLSGVINWVDITLSCVINWVEIKIIIRHS